MKQKLKENPRVLFLFHGVAIVLEVSPVLGETKSFTNIFRKRDESKEGNSVIFVLERESVRRREAKEKGKEQGRFGIWVSSSSKSKIAYDLKVIII